MNKSEMIDAIARHADISKAAAGRALDATVGAIKTSLRKGDIVTLVGFGSFYVGKRSPRAGRNPRTGVAIRPLATCCCGAWHPGSDSNTQERCWKPPASPSATGVYWCARLDSNQHSTRFERVASTDHRRRRNGRLVSSPLRRGLRAHW